MQDQGEPIVVNQVVEIQQDIVVLSERAQTRLRSANQP